MALASRQEKPTARGAERRAAELSGDGDDEHERAAEPELRRRERADVGAQAGDGEEEREEDDARQAAEVSGELLAEVRRRGA